MLTWHSIRNIVRNFSSIFDEWWWARSAINICKLLFLNDKPNVVLVLICNADLAHHSNYCKKSFLLYIWRMMMSALSYQHWYNTVLNDKSNVLLVLSCNADLAQHLNHCKKGGLYIWRMMMGALSHQHSYNFVFKRLNECCASVDLQCWPSTTFESLWEKFLYIWRMMMGALSHQHSYNTVLNDKSNVVLVLICNVDLT